MWKMKMIILYYKNMDFDYISIGINKKSIGMSSAEFNTTGQIPLETKLSSGDLLKFAEFAKSKGWTHERLNSVYSSATDKKTLIGDNFDPLTKDQLGVLGLLAEYDEYLRSSTEK